MDSFDFIVMIIKVLFVGMLMVSMAPVMAWVERRGSALIQNRLGPNRMGPLGLFQSVCDGIKFAFKEDMISSHVNKFYYVLAPLVSLVPAFMTFAVVPFASNLVYEGHEIRFQVANLNVGLLYVISIASLGVYGIIIAGWASNNKYALLGSLRSSSQMISYELSMGLALVGAILCYSSLDLNTVALYQGQTLIELGGFAIPKWGILLQPLGFLIFCTAAFAETNRLPFDLPEGESEIVAGYHLEYGSLKFSMFMMAEYANMFTASAMMVTLYFGGYQLFPGMHWLLEMMNLSGLSADIARVAFEMVSFFVKCAFFMWFYVWVRWTLPRFRYDQLMDLGWRVMLPLSLINILLTGVLVYYGVI